MGAETMPQRVRTVSSPDLLPFLRLLCDEGVLDANAGLIDTHLRISSRIQNLAYLAMRHFGHPGLDYKYNAFMGGPCSTAMLGDFEVIKDIRAACPPGRSHWPRLDEFRQFVAAHDANWIEIAATLSRINDQVNEGYRLHMDGEDRRACLLRIIHDTYSTVEPAYIADIHDEIKDIFLKISDSYRGGRCV